jgi:hypothetical protein
MNRGIIYLIQPAELVGTNRYKFGCSSNPNLERCKKGYKNGSRYLCIMECINPFILEKKIKIEFDNKFKLIAGNEYYEGNENEILNIFVTIVHEYINKYDNNSSISDDNNSISDDNSNISDNEQYINEVEVDEDIINCFPNYKDDISNGGKKELIKIIITDYECIIIKYINDNNLCEKNIDLRHDEYMKDFIENIITKNIIKNNEIYDLNDKQFLKKVDKYKKIYNVKLSTKNNTFINTINDYYNKNVNKQCISYKISHYFLNNSIINGLHTLEYEKYWFIFDDYDIINNVTKNYEFYKNQKMSIRKLNNIYYDDDYLEEFMPWFIEFKNDKDYYIVNRKYKYIGTNNISNPPTDIPITIYGDNIYGKRVWIKNTYEYVSNNYSDRNDYFTSIMNITKNKNCLNECNNTNELFVLLKMPKLKIISH